MNGEHIPVISRESASIIDGKQNESRDRLFRMGLTTRDGLPDSVGILALCGVFGATLYDDLKTSLNGIELDGLCEGFLFLRDSENASGMLDYLVELYSILGQKLPVQIGWAATNADVLHEFLFLLAQDFEEYLTEDRSLEIFRTARKNDSISVPAD
ncbi:MAG: hypothetical protein FWG14_14165 [Peptococcaceae bacterium]|nr:hypothetical protein [Peptococcaceae bacterium]